MGEKRVGLSRPGTGDNKYKGSLCPIRENRTRGGTDHRGPSEPLPGLQPSQWVRSRGPL